MQAIHISQHEYINAFGTNGLRQSVRNSVNGNHDYLVPPDPQPEQSESPQPQPQQHANPQSQPPQPVPPPHTSLPPTGAEFVQHVLARLQTGGGQAPQPAQATQPAPAKTRSAIATQAAPIPAPSPQTPAAPTVPFHRAGDPEPSEGSPLNHVASAAEETHPIPANQFARPVLAAAQPYNPPRTDPPTPQPAQNRIVRELHFDQNCRLRIDGKPF
jgi:hypothetical protein